MIGRAGMLADILPRAEAWALGLSTGVAESGSALDAVGEALARAVGVQKPQAIRLRQVAQLPIPHDKVLLEVVRSLGLLGPRAVGLTLGYSILVVEGCISNQLLAHEFRHVQQFESAGSLEQFIHSYLIELLRYGYSNSPMELDARAYESMAALTR